MSCDVGCRRSSDPTLLWLRRRLAAIATIGPLAWEPPYAMGAAVENAKRQKKKKIPYRIFFISSSVNGQLGCFHILAIVNSAGMNTGVHVSFGITVLFSYMPKTGIAGSYGNSIFRFLKNYYF